jgi:hypothetical protein
MYQRREANARPPIHQVTSRGRTAPAFERPEGSPGCGSPPTESPEESGTYEFGAGSASGGHAWNGRDSAPDRAPSPPAAGPTNRGHDRT